MIEDTNDAPFVERIRRNPTKWKKNKGDGFANKAKKHHKQRERELYEDGLEEDLKDYK